MAMAALTRRMERRCGLDVYGVGPEGFWLRPLGDRRRRGFVSAETLYRLVPERTRAAAFTKPLPARWLPEPGDWVWLRPKAAPRNRACGWVRTQGLTMMVEVGRQGECVMVELTDVRPAPEP